MPRAKSRKLRRLLVGSGEPRSRCKRRCKFCVRIRKGSAFSSRGSIRQTAGRAGRAGKKSSSARVASKSRPLSSSSTLQEYYATAPDFFLPSSLNDGFHFTAPQVGGNTFHCFQVRNGRKGSVSPVQQTRSAL